jgi:hypothetical protein
VASAACIAAPSGSTDSSITKREVCSPWTDLREPDQQSHSRPRLPATATATAASLLCALPFLHVPSSLISYSQEQKARGNRLGDEGKVLPCHCGLDLGHS